MLYLYYKPTCPFCQRVLTANESIGAPLVLRDVSADAALRDELMVKGGKPQVPFLVDEDRGIMLYESLDIIEYLETHYQTSDTPLMYPFDGGRQKEESVDTDSDSGDGGDGGD